MEADFLFISSAHDWPLRGPQALTFQQMCLGWQKIGVLGTSIPQSPLLGMKQKRSVLSISGFRAVIPGYSH